MNEQMESTGFIVGVDLGQSSDYTALCVVERVLSPRPWPHAPDRPLHHGGSGYNATGDRTQGVATLAPTPSDARVASYHVRHLERLPLDMKYPVIVQRVQGLVGTPPLDVRTTPLVIDHTGVGRAVADLFASTTIEPYAITITGGDRVTREGRRYRVPKRDLVGVLVMLFQSERLKIAAGLPDGPTLVNELMNFRVKINIATGNDRYEAWRESVHDDLVLAVALACWFGERKLPVWGAW